MNLQPKSKHWPDMPVMSMSGIRVGVTHQLQVCSCNKCEDGEDLKCKGADYHTRYVLTCPFSFFGLRNEMS